MQSINGMNVQNEELRVRAEELREGREEKEQEGQRERPKEPQNPWAKEYTSKLEYKGFLGMI